MASDGEVPTVAEKISLLRRLHGMLEFDPLETEEEFSKMMKTIFNECGVDKNCLLATKGFDAAAVDGWLTGHLPHKAFWPFIAEAVMKAVNSQINDYEEKTRMVDPRRPNQDGAYIVPLSSRQPANDDLK